jgi:hypothetical protein
VQVMKLLIMQFSQTSCHFISLRSKYSQQHPDLDWMVASSTQIESLNVLLTQILLYDCCSQIFVLCHISKGSVIQFNLLHP